MMVAATSRVASPLQGKALAALFALERASNLGMSRIILETDAMELKKALTTMNLDRSVEGSLFMQIRSFMNTSFDHWCVQHCPRKCNKVADCLAMYGASVVSSGSTVFMSQVPCCYSIPRPQRYFLIYFHSLANNRTSVNFVY
jgi:hypothetical protein